MRKLALDLGSRTCGFAISDELEVIAIGLDNFRFFEDDYEAVKNEVLRYMKEYKIDGIILGYPKKNDGSKSDSTYRVENFKDLLSKFIDIPIIYVDEQYSTKNAEKILIALGLTRQKRKNFKDKLAAQLILEDYLNYYRR
ncbi:Holliday junction resolvase RuvX [Mycoplasma crocodyli]|uniref:Putative pre-16S rRNA nuclease n=1 Tax=Mycoplasma crocodyli (strain ATCC 51981 / MP145) TaxID=512564 RepID=D5E529_MYCCM|nr:Holliday junction resolvase RuvX [Mycoplasma crocodyli]ADE19695.1 putative Holliday junction resolvase [Mycoplasma crocodyli MP145]